MQAAGGWKERTALQGSENKARLGGLGCGEGSNIRRAKPDPSVLLMTAREICRVTEKETGEQRRSGDRSLSAYSLSPGKATCFGEKLEAGACGPALSLSKTRFSAQALPCRGWSILPSLYLSFPSWKNSVISPHRRQAGTQ